jgi:hypothetical protein
LELAFQGGFVWRRRHGSASPTACCHWRTLRVNMKGPPAGTAVGNPDSRVRSTLRRALSGQLLSTQIPAQWLTTIRTDRAAGPAIIGLERHAPIVPEHGRFCLGACR